MNTMAKGNHFEDAVCDVIAEELRNDGLGLSPAIARMFRKKGYFSRDRGANIVVDISIEVWPPGAKNYSLLWVCECKNYGHPIPVDDLEEFKAKLDQIAGKSVKGVFATSHSLQSGALSFAKANGIGVVRILTDKQVRWVAHLSAAQTSHGPAAGEHALALSREDLVGNNQAFYGACGGYYLDDWGQVLEVTIRE
jgi:hypothetical protein